MMRPWMVFSVAMLVGAVPALAAMDAPGNAANLREQERQGSIQAIDLKGTPPTLKLIGSNGRTWTLALDMKKTAVTRSGKTAKLEQLRVGQDVTVAMEMKDGREIAKAIQVGVEKEDKSGG